MRLLYSIIPSSKEVNLDGVNFTASTLSVAACPSHLCVYPLGSLLLCPWLPFKSRLCSLWQEWLCSNSFLPSPAYYLPVLLRCHLPQRTFSDPTPKPHPPSPLPHLWDWVIPTHLGNTPPLLRLFPALSHRIAMVCLSVSPLNWKLHEARSWILLPTAVAVSALGIGFTHSLSEHLLTASCVPGARNKWWTETRCTPPQSCWHFLHTQLSPHALAFCWIPLSQICCAEWHQGVRLCYKSSVKTHAGGWSHTP